VGRSEVSDPPVLVHRLIARLNTGGPAIHVVHLAEALDPTRFRTRLITGRITEDEGDMTYYARERGVEVTEITGMSRLLSPLGDLRSFLTLLRLFRRERPVIVHTHTAKAGTVGRLAAYVARVPVIVHTFHGHVLGGRYFSRLKTRFFLEVERQLARATDRLVVLTNFQAREMSESLRVAPSDRFTVIPLGLDLQPFADADRAAARSRLRAELGIDQDRPVVGIVGRMVPVKNHELLFDAMVLLSHRMDLAPHLIVVGSGERERTLRSYVSDNGVEDVVHWLGWRKDLPQIFPAFDVTVLTSLDEGTPVSLIESLASGTPVVSLAVGGVPEIFDGGELGCLVHSAWDDEVAAGLDSVLASPPSPEDRERARKLVLERFSIQRLAEDVERLYVEALKQAGVGA
jgi:glycosyltransferase involved in cell wall biosynthesis